MNEACRQLGVRQQTLYAYTSRGKLEAMADPADSRRSLYRADDVARLAQRKQAGRKRETLASQALSGVEPSIPTALSTFHRGSLFYRGQDAVQLAQSGSLEQLAQLLWASEGPITFSTDGAKPPQPGRAAAFSVLGVLAAQGLSTQGRSPRVLCEEAQALVGQLALAMGAQRSARPLHERLAKGWKQTAAVADLLRVALVLLADHELTSSAFATRIAASTGASLPACLLAGLCTLSGPSHGDASGQIQGHLAEVERLGADAVVQRHLAMGLPLAGFGHHLYPDGDPRAQALLALFDPSPRVARFIQQASAQTGLPPNVDMALAALVAHLNLPADASFGMIAIARSVGLLAHCFEQLAVRQSIRPRGRYVGPRLVGV
jgi:citrate synthase